MTPPSMQNLHASNGMSWPAAANLFDPNASSSGLQSLVTPSSTPRKPPKDSLESLVALPVVRPIPWIEGKELPSEKSTHSARIQTRGAFLLSTRGINNEPPCTHCKTGSGRFAQCISLPSWFGGACSTCQMATRANLCSIRVEREQRLSSASQMPEISTLRSPSPADNEEPQDAMKRKRNSENLESNIPNPRPFVPPYTDAIVNAYAQNPSFTTSITTPQNAIADEPSAVLKYVHQKQNLPDEKKHYHLINQALRDSEDLAKRTYMSDYNNNIGVDLSTNNRESSNTAGTTMLSPNVQYIHNTQPTQSYANNGTMVQSSGRDENQQTISLIDTLPRRKQKQIFGIIGGIQSGIRSVRQQTETLQKQLDLLQEALGIDFDPDDDVP